MNLSWPAPVHPRVCGEQGCGRFRSHKRRGSSPRVRGTVEHALDHQGIARFIPACAGNRTAFCCFALPCAVHPRVCGEQSIRESTSMLPAGSSPRVRGTEHPRVNVNASRRFIPACAGNSISRSISPIRKAVHPRVCGEQINRTLAVFSYRGSSPRVRGTGRERRLSRPRRRFIPACAGNSDLELDNPRLSAVHPRVCGEQLPISR